MCEKIIIITPEDNIKLADYNGYESLSGAVDGTISRFYEIELSVYPFLADGKDFLPVELYCNDDFLIKDDKQFDKINAVASSISGQEIRGNVAMVVKNGENDRGFRYIEEDAHGKTEEALCECWSAEDTILYYINTNKDKFKEFHSKMDNNKSKSSFEITNLEL